MSRPRRHHEDEKSVFDMRLEHYASFERGSKGVSRDESRSESPLPSAEEQKKPTIRDSPPDGGLIAWLQVLAGFLLVLNSRGLTNTFGVFQEYYSTSGHELQGTSPSAISWIGSIQTFLLMFGGVFCGRLLDAGHLRVQLCAGISLQFLGTMLTSFATRYWQVLIAQGFCVGIGSSFLWLPSVVVIAQYFESKIMIATGIAATGSSAAGVVYPILVKKMIIKVGFPWTVRIFAFVLLGLNGICLALMRLRIPPRKGGKFFDMTMFRDPPYTAFVASMVFLYASVYVPYFYIQDYARSVGIDSKVQIYVLSIMNGASLVSRIIPSWVADIVGGLNVLIPCTIISCASIFALPFVTNTTGLLSLTIIYGLFSGALVSLPPATIASISKNPDEYGTRIGMAFAVCAYGVLGGNPTAGVLLASGEKAGEARPYTRLWFFAGGLMFIAVVLVGITRYLVACCVEPDEEGDTDSIIQFEQQEDDLPPLSPRHAHHHHHVIPTRHGKRWHQILVQDAVAMQGLSAY
ncbi:hypothetical protein FGG08_006496 [Glutinoglossum americanum]|uniref:Major facilitator superfamily (MFS) profile domain-containing protein n=1 Tax=Glutinoglossum americanum TaxID=1670608 RepID=A0A9P8KXF1_9PEZI|nr:hypothetical protein FGG08_006496 [Glutinoglossum americanum]